MDINTTKTLNNGVEIPIIGLGVFKSGIHTYRAVRHALEAGYRHIDTASYYQNEEAVGKAVRDSGIDREEVFITSKLWTDDMRKRRVRQALEKSLSLLNTDYLDLYLIHWPVKEEFVNSYKVMEELRSEGKNQSHRRKQFSNPSSQDIDDSNQFNARRQSNRKSSLSPTTTKFLSFADKTISCPKAGVLWPEGKPLKTPNLKFWHPNTTKR